MKKLRTYLADKNKGDFARKVDIAPAYLSQLLSPKGNRRPSFDLMVRIEKATDGFVDLKSWADGEVSA